MIFDKSTPLESSAEDVWAWHMRPGAFERLAPPWQTVRSLGEVEVPRLGSRVRLRLGRGPLATRWTAEHTAIEPGRAFEDVQVQGPFRRWRHRHEFLPTDSESSVLRDRIDYEIPGGRLMHRVAGPWIESSIARTFRYRHRVTAEDLEFHGRYPGVRSLRVGITGATGLVGRAVRSMLTTGGHEVVRLVRSEIPSKSPNEAAWTPAAGALEPSKLEGLDAVIHLAGENISQRRWTPEQKRRIRESRIQGTRRLVDSLAGLSNPPRIFLSASATGYYGDRGDEVVTEASEPGRGFLADLCREWEEAAAAASRWAMRVAVARLGVVLSPQGGALAKMLPAFRLGAGGRIGTGEQYLSWISIDDAASALIHILQTDDLAGPVNLVAPGPRRNRDFAQALGKTLRRPAVMPLPAGVARLLFGEMAEEALLSGSRVEPRELLQHDFRFRHSKLEAALGYMLGRD